MPLIVRMTPIFLRSALSCLGLIGSFASCNNVQPVTPNGPPITDPTQLYMRLTLNHRAVTLSTAEPYATLQLEATPRDALGSAMAGLPAPTFRSLDTSTVMVTEDGLLTALQPGSGIIVIAQLKYGAVLRNDTAIVDVTTLTAPPTLASLSLDPIAPDSANWSIWLGGRGFSILSGLSQLAPPPFVPITQPKVIPNLLSTVGTPIVGVPVDLESLDPTIVEISREREGDVLTHRPGRARIVARTTVYGVTKVDTVTFTVTLPIVRDVHIELGPGGKPTFTPEVRIAPYGLVMWFNFLSDPSDTVDVTFDDPAIDMMVYARLCEAIASILGPAPYCGVGNVLVPPLPNPTDPDAFYYTLRVRQFPTQGVYTYRSVRTGASGRIVVGTQAGE